MLGKIEIACFNVDSAIIAQEHGADRIELCAERALGGITPSYEDVAKVRELVTIDLYAMVRPRGGNFVYSDDEFEQMCRTILRMKELGVDGLVFGILNGNNSINVVQNQALVELAHPTPCTFHRAFDHVVDMSQALEDVISCGFKTVLTSGGKPNVMEGIYFLRELVGRARSRIVIMPGGGLRSNNIQQVRRETRAIYFHSSAIVNDGDTADTEEVKALKAKVVIV